MASRTWSVLLGYLGTALDVFERPIVAVIHLCGWSAIIFVFAIFIFIFSAGGPFLTNTYEESAEGSRARVAEIGSRLVLGIGPGATEQDTFAVVRQSLRSGDVQGVQGLWRNARSESERRFLLPLDPGYAPADVYRSLQASVAAQVRAASETDEKSSTKRKTSLSFDPEKVGVSLLEGLDGSGGGSGARSMAEAIVPFLEASDTASRLVKAGLGGPGSEVEDVWYPSQAGSKVLVIPAAGVDAGAVSRDLLGLLPRKALALELPYENPEEATLETLREAVAEDRIEGVDEVLLQTHPGLRVVLTLEDDALPDDVSRQVLETIPFRQGYSHLFVFFTSKNWRPDSEIRREFGILALLVGSLSVTCLALLIAVPFSLGAAIFVSEFVGGKVKETLKIVIEILAAIPSVVWGFIGYMVMNPIIIWLTGQPIGINMLNGGIILALMCIPIIVSLSEDALRAVPDGYREAAVALGASRWQVVYKVLFPAAKNGLLAAVLLGFGRAIGETMAVLMATGHAIQIPGSILDPVRTLTATIAAELGECVRGGGHYRALFMIGMVLMLIAFAVNLTADIIVKGIRGKQNV